MIEGLKCTVNGTELVLLCEKHSQYHAERAEVYRGQIASMEKDKIEGMNYTNGDPINALQQRLTIHENEAAELRFYAEHIDTSETYILEHKDLNRLGITRSAY